MTFFHRMRRAARILGLEVTRANPMTVFRCRLPELLRRHRISLVLDVGANDGGYASELIEGGYEGTIHSFEPLPSAHERLVRRTAELGQGRWLAGPRVAIGDGTGVVELLEAGNSASTSILPMADAHLEAAPESATIARHRIPMWTIDELLEAHDFAGAEGGALLKIDVQGAELAVLRGAQSALSGPVRMVQLEMSLIELYHGQALAAEVNDHLTTRGFALWDIVPGFRNPNTLRLLQYDGIYIREPK